jgi:hypothetical protein
VLVCEDYIRLEEDDDNNYDYYISAARMLAWTRHTNCSTSFCRHVVIPINIHTTHTHTHTGLGSRLQGSKDGLPSVAVWDGEREVCSCVREREREREEYRQ